MPIQLPVSVDHIQLDKTLEGKGDTKSGKELTAHFKVLYADLDAFLTQVFGLMARSVPIAWPNAPDLYADAYSFRAFGTDANAIDYRFADVGLTFRALEYDPEDPSLPFLSWEMDAAGQTYPMPEGGFQFDTGDADLDKYPVPGRAFFASESALSVTLHRVQYQSLYNNISLLDSAVNHINSVDFLFFDWAPKEVLFAGYKAARPYRTFGERATDIDLRFVHSGGTSAFDSQNPRWDKTIHPKQGVGWQKIKDSHGDPPFPTFDLNTLLNVS